jgi:hypothetical protein
MRKIFIFFCAMTLVPNIVFAQVVFTEVMYDPTGADSGHEWVEIYNQGSDPIALDDQWKFFDGSSHILNVTQGTATLAPHALAVIADKPDLFLTQYPLYSGILFDSVVSIGNSGSTIALYNNGQATGDSSLTFDPSWGGSGNNKTLEKVDVAGGNDRVNWHESTVDLGTPGAFPDLSPDPLPTPHPIQVQGKLILTELLPNPAGSDTEAEWIELHNTSEQLLPLEGITVQDSSGTVYRFPASTSINAAAYLVLSRTISHIALNNDHDTVILQDDQGTELDRVEYAETAAEGRSYALIDDQWQWSSQPTPSAENMVPVNQSPVVNYSLSGEPYIIGTSIAFDASSSFDPEGDALTFAWDFTDGTTSNRKSTSHTFKTPGTFKISLRATDQQGLVSEHIISLDIHDKETATATTKKTTNTLTAQQATSTTSRLAPVVDTVRLSEFLPNPAGSDAGEWIELYNTGDTDVDISQWQLDDEDGGSKPFHFPSGSLITSHTYQVWSKAATKLALNNNTDSVRLLDADNNLLDSVEYTGGKEGQSYEKDFDSEEWRWQSNPTMGLPAVLVLGVSTSLESASDTDQLYVPAHSAEGIVVVEPNSWYKQKFYIQTLDAPEEQLVEVYNARGNFPELRSGDQIIVQNYVETPSGDIRRLKISTPDQIVIAAHQQTIAPTVESLGDITDDDINHIISVSAQVNTVATQSLSLTDDSSTLSVYLGPDWSGAKPVKGSTVTIAGVIQKSSGKLRLRALSVMEEERQSATTTVETNTTTIHTVGPNTTKKPTTVMMGWYTFIALVIIGLIYGGYRWWFIGKR